MKAYYSEPMKLPLFKQNANCLTVAMFIDERSWTVSRRTIESNNFDLKAVNPNKKIEEDTRTPEELITLIEAKQKEIDLAIRELKK